MVKITAQLNALRISPRKVRLVGDAIKGKDVKFAEKELLFRTKRAADPLVKLLKSAVANARNNFQVKEDAKLVVRDVRVDQGRVFKRYMPRARGRASLIRKKTSNVTMVLETENLK